MYVYWNENMFWKWNLHSHVIKCCLYLCGCHFMIRVPVCHLYVSGCPFMMCCSVWCVYLELPFYDMCCNVSFVYLRMSLYDIYVALQCAMCMSGLPSYDLCSSVSVCHPPLIRTACPQPGPVLPPGADLLRKQWVKLNRLRCGTARVGDTLKLWGAQESATCACGHTTQSVQHVVVDCMIHKAPGFAGLRRPDAATRSWLKDLNFEIWRTANDYIYLYVQACHIMLSVAVCHLHVGASDDADTTVRPPSAVSTLLRQDYPSGRCTALHASQMCHLSQWCPEIETAGWSAGQKSQQYTVQIYRLSSASTRLQNCGASWSCWSPDTSEEHRDALL